MHFIHISHTSITGHITFALVPSRATSWCLAVPRPSGPVILRSLLAGRWTAPKHLSVAFLHLFGRFHAWFEQEDGRGGGERHHQGGADQNAWRCFHLARPFGGGQEPSHVVRSLCTHVSDRQTDRLRAWSARGRPSQLRHRHRTRRHRLANRRVTFLPRSNPVCARVRDPSKPIGSPFDRRGTRAYRPHARMDRDLFRKDCDRNEKRSMFRRSGRCHVGWKGLGEADEAPSNASLMEINRCSLEITLEIHHQTMV